MLQRIFSDIIEVALITSGVIAILLLLLPFLRRHYTAGGVPGSGFWWQCAC